MCPESSVYKFQDTSFYNIQPDKILNQRNTIFPVKVSSPVWTRTK